MVSPLFLPFILPHDKREPCHFLAFISKASGTLKSLFVFFPDLIQFCSDHGYPVPPLLLTLFYFTVMWKEKIVLND